MYTQLQIKPYVFIMLNIYCTVVPLVRELDIIAVHVGFSPCKNDKVIAKRDGFKFASAIRIFD